MFKFGRTNFSAPHDLWKEVFAHTDFGALTRAKHRHCRRRCCWGTIAWPEDTRRNFLFVANLGRPVPRPKVRQTHDEQNNCAHNLHSFRSRTNFSTSMCSGLRLKFDCHWGGGGQIDMIKAFDFYPYQLPSRKRSSTKTSINYIHKKVTPI